MDNTNLLAALANCAAACNYCSDKCLDEDDIKKMVKCIRLDRDCETLCYTAHSLVASNSAMAKDAVRLCLQSVKACGDECEKMEQDHCKECARACRECQKACEAYLA